ncbi:MAG: hypothetical protein AAB883_03280 [Patescibacteria group bacterium]
MLTKQLMVAACALSLAVGSPVAMGGVAYAAPVHEFHSFCPDGPGQAELARRMEDSVKNQPDGTRRLDKCYATAIQFLHSLRAADPESVKKGTLDTVQQLPAYIRWLKPKAYAQSAEYISACVKGKAPGIEDVKLECEPRTLTRTETMLVNPETGKPVLMGNCSNPIIKEAEQVVVSPCYSILFVPLARPDAVATAVRIGELSKTPPPRSECDGWKQPGDTEMRSDRPQECPDKLCNYAEVADTFNVILRREMSFVPRKQGEYTYLVSEFMAKNGMVVICLDVRLADGRVVRTYGQGVIKENYDGTRTAHVTDWKISDRLVPASAQN